MVNIPGYSISAKVAEGACAEIYSAVDLQTGKTVAIKVLHPQHIANKAEYKRLTEEGALGLRLPQHDNIVQFYKVGAVNKIPYVVLEYVEGHTLRELLPDRKRFTNIEILNLAKGIARALRFIHNVNICHKDLKPDNVMINNVGVVKLLDFGFAENIKSFSLFRRHLEGSVEYMAPELFHTKKCTPATDIYALGCTLYEAATGFPPFGGMSNIEVIAKQKNMKLTAPSVHDANPLITHITERTISTAIEKDPAKRFKSADEVLLELSRNPAVRDAKETRCLAAKR